MLPWRARCARGPQLLTMDRMSLRYNVWELQFMYLFINFTCLFIFFIYLHMVNLCILEVISKRSYTYQMLRSFRRGGRLGGGGVRIPAVGNRRTGWNTHLMSFRNAIQMILCVSNVFIP